MLEKLKKMSKKNRVILAITIILVLFLSVFLFTETFAYWKLTDTQNNSNLASTACFDITFEETGTDITLANAFPISNEKGLASTPYKFKIKNICDVSAKYYVTLNSFGTTEDLLSEDAIRYAIDLSKYESSTYLTKILGTAKENTNTANINLTDLIKSYTIETGYLKAQEEKEYSLHLWLDAYAPMTEMKKYFQAKVYITAVAEEAGIEAYLATATESSATSNFLNSTIVKNTIESIEFVDTNRVPEDALYVWDASAEQNGAIKGWTYDIDGNGLFEVYIGQKDEVIANPASTWLFENLINLKTINLEKLNTSNVIDMGAMFEGDYNLLELDLSSFDTSKVRWMTRMFQYCSKLTKIIQNFNTSNVEITNSMFAECRKLVDLNVSNFDTSKVTNMAYMFSYCMAIQTIDVSNFNTANVDTMFRMFEYCNELLSLDLSNFNTSKVTSMLSLFSGCKKITSLDLSSFDTSNVTSMNSMFSGCSSLTDVNLSSFDTKSVSNMASMFHSCTSLETVNINHFNTSLVNDFGTMFGYSTKLKTLDLSNWDTSRVTSLYGMFINCSALSNLNLSNWNTEKVVTMVNAFTNCSSLTTLDLSSFVTPLLTKMESAQTYEYGSFQGMTNLQNLYLNQMNFDGVTTTNNKIFRSIPNTATIYVKDNAAKIFVQNYFNGIITIV